MKAPDWKKTLVNERGGSCESCGYLVKDEADFAVFDFHHRDGEDKAFGLATGTRSLDARRKEAEKCDLLCANCHRRVHAFDGGMSPGRPRGTGKLRMSDEALLELSESWKAGERSKSARELGAMYGVGEKAVFAAIRRAKERRHGQG